ncbi:hypothetical protein CHS0354_029348 [Potamilus streckersoni]|uniref:G-protein coupled receptors family 1 profile domain-containing protein n=1 Tax=Potamilus streckersoni TaxID=2493646 RepID=A0AAE0SYT7_9BIVA|nr:hypothetical protein CHS0354_029348 [Potamilus streckersoni]
MTITTHVLAILDLLVLYIGLFRLWIGQFMTDDPRDSSNWLCKGILFLGYVSSDSSVWLIVAVTLERYIAVCFPLPALRISNVKTARITIVFVVAVFCVINMHLIWTVGVREFYVNGTLHSNCGADNLHKRLVEEIWPWIDVAFYSFLPFLIILTLNICIIKTVFLARKRRSDLQNRSRTDSAKSSCKMADSNERERENKMTVVLLVVSFTFLLTTQPLSLCILFTAFWNATDYVEFTRFSLIETIATLLMYTNHSINFFLYCATGKKFRKQFRALLCSFCTERSSRRNFASDSKRSMTTNYRMTGYTSSGSPNIVVHRSEPSPDIARTTL